MPCFVLRVVQRGRLNLEGKRTTTVGRWLRTRLCACIYFILAKRSCL